MRSTKDNHNSHRLSGASMIVACIALFVVLGGSAFAAKSLITGKQVAKNTLTAKNVKDGSLKEVDLNKRTVASLRGAKGDKGDQGVQGVQGQQGPAGITAPLSAIDLQENIGANATVTAIQLFVPSGKYVVSARGNLFTNGVLQLGCTLEANDVTIPSSRANYNPDNGNTGSSVIPLSTQGVAPAGTTKLEFVCSADADTASISDSSLIAIPVS